LSAESRATVSFVYPLRRQSVRTRDQRKDEISFSWKVWMSSSQRNRTYRKRGISQSIAQHGKACLFQLYEAIEERNPISFSEGSGGEKSREEREEREGDLPVVDPTLREAVIAGWRTSWCTTV